MKTYEWLILVAALLITVCEVLLFTSQAAGAPQKQANVAVGTDVASGRHSPGG